MKRSIILLMIVIPICVIVVLSIYNSRQLQYNNYIHCTDLITHYYSKEEIIELEKVIAYNKSSFTELEDKYEIECIRKIPNSDNYYVVFLQHDGGRVFLFINEKQEVVEMFKLHNVKSKERFDEWISSKDVFSEEEILKFDDNVYYMPISSVGVNIHFVQQGAYVLQYDHDHDNDSSPIAIDYISNDNIKEFKAAGIPYILEIDKK